MDCKFIPTAEYLRSATGTFSCTHHHRYTAPRFLSAQIFFSLLCFLKKGWTIALSKLSKACASLTAHTLPFSWRPSASSQGLWSSMFAVAAEGVLDSPDILLLMLLRSLELNFFSCHISLIPCLACASMSLNAASSPGQTIAVS